MQVKMIDLVTDCDKINIDDVVNIMNSKTDIVKWAYIKHDKCNTRAHYHICMKFVDSRNSKHIAQWFGIGDNFFEKVKGYWKDILLYLTHKNAPEKFQYDDSEVIANFDFLADIKKGQELTRKEQIVESIVNGSIREYNYFNFITPNEFDKFNKSINNAFKYRVDVMKGETREMNCIFITGDSGTGKTTYAKQISKDKGFSIYISSGSNDVLDDYKGQDCVVLDDLRPSTLGLADLLKMLDNHTSSTVKSRYKNKVLECKLIIITTTLDIDTFFSNVFMEEYETCVQLKRRCKLYIKMYLDNIYLSVWHDLSRRYGIPIIQRNPVADMYVNKDLTIDEELLFLENILGMPVAQILKEKDCDLIPTQENFPFE